MGRAVVVRGGCKVAEVDREVAVVKRRRALVGKNEGWEHRTARPLAQHRNPRRRELPATIRWGLLNPVRLLGTRCSCCRHASSGPFHDTNAAHLQNASRHSAREFRIRIQRSSQWHQEFITRRSGCLQGWPSRQRNHENGRDFSLIGEISQNFQPWSPHVRAAVALVTKDPLLGYQPMPLLFFALSSRDST